MAEREKTIHVLLVDDDEDDYVLTRDLLAKAVEIRFDLEWMDAYEAGLKALEQARHDVCLVDYRLGERNGLELLREAIARGYTAPIIMLTGQGDRAVDVAAMQAGAADFIDKGRLNAPLLERSIRYAIERNQAEVRIKHLNAVLRAIRNVNQLIVREKDRDQLLQSACQSLIETRGYYNVWIALWDESRELAATAQAGLDEEFLSLVEQLECGEQIYCIQQAFAQQDVVVIADPFSTCINCSLSGKYRGRGGMAVRLEHRGKVYGLLTISVSRAFMADQEEQNLLQEVAGDIALALHSIELEKEHRWAEKALEESENRYRTLFEGTAEGILVVDLETQLFRYSNPALCRMLGYSEKELAQMTVADIHPAADLAHVISEFEAQARGEKTLAPNIPCLRKDGTTMYADINTTVVLIDGRTCNVGFFTDVTEHRQIEKQLRQQERLAAVGQLASGIAHDFNNLLTTIILYAQMSLGKPDLPPHLTRSLETIIDESHKAAELVQQILDFSRRAPIETQPLNLDTFIKQTARILRWTIPENIHLSLDPAPQQVVVHADPTRIQQVLMNLALNARDAMPDGGELRIGLTHVETRSGEIPPLVEMEPGE